MPLIDNKTQVKVRYYLPDNAVLTELSDLFSVLSDSTRIKILSAICISEMCVGDLSEMLDMNQTTVSHQLKILRSTGIVTARRDGKNDILFARKYDNSRNYAFRNALSWVLLNVCQQIIIRTLA